MTVSLARAAPLLLLAALALAAVHAQDADNVLDQTALDDAALGGAPAATSQRSFPAAPLAPLNDESSETTGGLPQDTNDLEEDVNSMPAAPARPQLDTDRSRVQKAGLPNPFALSMDLDQSVGATDISTNSDAPAAARLANGKVAVWSQVLDIKQLKPDAKHIAWMRLVFDTERTVLRMPGGGPGTAGWGENLPGDVVRMTSLRDNRVMFHNAMTLKQWKFRSAFFNGDTIKVELFADPTLQGKPSLVIRNVQVNGQEALPELVEVPQPKALCNAADQRKPYQDPRIARIYPVGCTASVINDANGCLVSAGHCFWADFLYPNDEMVIQINVPPSVVMPLSKGGSVSVAQHPDPKFQWAVDVNSVQWFYEGYKRRPEDEDYSYFGSFPNPMTGLTHRDTIGGKSFQLARVVEREGGHYDYAARNFQAGAPVRIAGYGVAPGTLHQFQQASLGPLTTDIDQYHLSHRVDTTGGQSGAAVVLENNSNMVIALHTDGLCKPDDNGSTNVASKITMRGLQRALRAPKGVCAPRR